MEPDSLGKRIKAMRTKRGLSMRALAKASGVPSSTLSFVEGGQRQGDDLSVRSARRLALAFGVTLDYLCGTEEELPHA